MNCGVVWATGDGRQPSAREAPESSVFGDLKVGLRARAKLPYLRIRTEGSEKTILVHGGAMAPQPTPRFAPSGTAAISPPCRVAQERRDLRRARPAAGRFGHGLPSRAICAARSRTVPQA